jgi:Flp pilus assembly pilin Flp
VIAAGSLCVLSAGAREKPRICSLPVSFLGMPTTTVARHLRFIACFGKANFGMLGKFLRDESAQSLVEYALIIALVSVAAIAALQMIGAGRNKTFQNASNNLS